MRRTHEEYNRDGSKAPPDPYEGTYDFPEWSTWRLVRRMGDLLESQQIAHREERRAQITRELSQIVFEIEKGYDPITQQRRQVNG